MNKIRLNVLGLSYSQTQTGAYALVLSEDTGDRRIPIIIGGFEAQAIAIELEGLKPPRPLTHDLFVTMAKNAGMNIKEVNIIRLEEGVFYSELVVEKDGKFSSMDARTSDAVALALRFKCPIFTTSDIIEKAGIVMDYNQPEAEKKPKLQKKPIGYEAKSTEDLNKLMEEAIEKENYELASKIKKEIERRNSM
ncbi:MAG: bifunctional nuclease family protein [Bacteroidales bacterium]|nr:bifunctional nuclease family protein [Bacteroidales bacterium]